MLFPFRRNVWSAEGCRLRIVTFNLPQSTEFDEDPGLQSVAICNLDSAVRLLLNVSLQL